MEKKAASVDVRTALASRLVGRNDSQSDDVKSVTFAALLSVNFICKAGVLRMMFAEVRH